LLKYVFIKISMYTCRKHFWDYGRRFRNRPQHCPKEKTKVRERERENEK